MRLVLLAIAVVAIVAVFSATGASAGPGIAVDHATGSAGDTFVFSAAGFEPGTVLRGKYTAPNGREYGFSEGYGEKSFIAGADGTWSFSFSPATSPYGGATSGGWTMTFCLAQDATMCWSSDFKVEGGSGGDAGTSSY